MLDQSKLDHSKEFIQEILTEIPTERRYYRNKNAEELWNIITQEFSDETKQTQRNEEGIKKCFRRDETFLGGVITQRQTFNYCIIMQIIFPLLVKNKWCHHHLTLYYYVNCVSTFSGK